MAGRETSIWPFVALAVVGGAAAVALVGPKQAPPRGRVVAGAAGERTGTAFAEEAAQLKSDEERQELGLQWLLDGEVPAPTLDWKRVDYTAKDADGDMHEVSIWVSPDYLSAGTNDDHIVIPLGLPNAVRAAEALHFELPTSAIVDRVWQAAEKRYVPKPLPATSGSGMRLPAYWLKARDLITAQGTVPPSTLVAGHKKDVVLTPQIIARPGRLAIYGWHEPNGKPIQPVSLFHGKDYADYSHGIRAVHPTVEIDGRRFPYRDVLRDPELAPLVSKEGAFDPDAIYGWAMDDAAWNMA